MEKIFRYLQGYLKIRVWGYSPERFMNLCSNHHILLWDIARQGDEYTMYISSAFRFFQASADYEENRYKGGRAGALRPAFFIRRMRKRKVFALGLPCCLAFLIAMSRFPCGP